MNHERRFVSRCVAGNCFFKILISHLIVVLLGSFVISNARAQSVPGSSPAAGVTPQLNWSVPTKKVTTTSGEEIVIGVGSDRSLLVCCFLGTECPLAKLYGPRLQSLAQQYTGAAEGAGIKLQFLGIFSNLQDDAEEIAQYVEQHGLTFPMVIDASQELADLLMASRTPEVVVVDATGAIPYRGRIDDQYQPGIARDKATTFDLRNALTALVDGEQPAVSRTSAVGCLIGRRKSPSAESLASPDVTFNEHISRILQTNCVECHREGQIGPFALDDYDEVVGWGDMLLEVIDQGRMPPWHAAPPHDRFVGARTMRPAEVEMLRRWVALGMPEGDSQVEPTRLSWVEGWSLPRQPDLVLPMSDQPMKVPAEGVVDYQYFVVDPKLTEDRWVQAAEVVPGNSRVVHHAICFVRPPDGQEFRGVGWLGAYVPGQRPAVLPPGYARFLPAGSRLVFQMHYTPAGTEAEDITSVGIVFADPNQVEHEVQTELALNQSFEIPAGAGRHQVQATYRGFAPGSQLFSIMPHMHYRGFAFEVDLVGGEQRQRLLEVPRYDFNWQHDYRLNEPISLDRFERLEFKATFDNSDENPWNPDPTVAVTWGDQSWEEMAVAFFDISRPRDPAQRAQLATATPRTEEELSAERAEKRQRFVDDFFARLDKDGNGVIYPLETPQSFSAFGFRRIDRNGDRRIERFEVEEYADAREYE